MEDVCISLPDDVELKPVGTISGIIKQLGMNILIHTHLQYYL